MNYKKGRNQDVLYIGTLSEVAVCVCVCVCVCAKY